MRYLCLLRGINVGGNNKVTMADLRESFETAGLTNTHTYINSGNIFFDSDVTDTAALVTICEQVIHKRFGFPFVVMVISETEYKAAFNHAPKWWAMGDKKETRNEAIFVIPPTKSADVIKALDVKRDGPDKVDYYGQVIFWSLPMSAYSKSVVPRIIGTPVYRRLPRRSTTTAKTLR